MYKIEIDKILTQLKVYGEIAMKAFSSKSFEVRNKGTGDIVTEVDLKINDLFNEFIQGDFSNDFVLSEETQDDFKQREKAERLWIIDPIDGTREFALGNPEFAISIALIKQNQAVLGFVYNPAKDFLVYGGPQMGLKNQGSFPAPVKREQLQLCVSRSEKKKGLFKKFEERLGMTNIKPVGSTAYKLALVAAGHYDAVISKRPKNEWDIAAGAALLQSTGKILLHPNFDQVTFNNKQTKLQGLIAGSSDAKSQLQNLGLI